MEVQKLNPQKDINEIEDIAWSNWNSNQRSYKISEKINKITKKEEQLKNGNFKDMINEEEDDDFKKKLQKADQEIKKNNKSLKIYENDRKEMKIKVFWNDSKVIKLKNNLQKKEY